MEPNEKNQPVLAGLRTVRKLRGMRQQDLANEMEVEPKHICRYEKTERLPKLPILRKLCQVLNCRLWQLFYDPENDTQAAA